MAYSRWATVEELKSKLTPVSYDSEIKKSGIPMMYDEIIFILKMMKLILWLLVQQVVVRLNQQCYHN